MSPLADKVFTDKDNVNFVQITNFKVSYKECEVALKSRSKS